MTALELYLPLVSGMAFFVGWVGAMVTGIFFREVLV